MLDRFAVDVVEGVNASLAGSSVEGTVTGGAAAADRVVDLMKFAINRLNPEQLVIEYVKAKGPQRSKKLWEKTGEQTIDCLSAGAVCMADLWDSAWIEGGGEGQFSQTQLKSAVHKNKLRALYNTKTFLESNWLKDMSFS
jgi:hypothetical protein